MKYRMLGSTGTSVATLALGTMGFGTESSEEDSFAVLDAFIEASGNILDTSDRYGDGASETTLGKWFANRPRDVTDRVILATKGRFTTGPDMNDAGLSRRHLDRTLNASLRRLGRDNVDLYQLHGWDPLTPIEETLGFIGDAIRQGKIHYYGLSNFTGWQVQLTVSTAQAMGVPIPVTIQSQYSLASREIEFEVIPAALHNHVGVLPWSPLASGFLTGKYTRGEQADSSSRGGSGNPLFEHVINDLASREQNWHIVDTLIEVADSEGLTPATTALAWVNDRPGVTASIIGARNTRQLKQNLAAADVVLSDAARQRLDDVSTPRSNDYPYGPFGVKQNGRYIDSSAEVLGELWAS
jgi:aryl-alcohol dehydrogenase-like predicted oxidoreductase